MSTDASTATGGTSQSPQTGQAANIGSTQAQINNLAGGLSNANVNGTVGPHFFVARLNDEAMTLALYGWLKSDKCCLGLQGKVQLPEEVNCASDFLEVFHKKTGMDAGRALSFGKIVFKNVSKLKPADYDPDEQWNWDKGFLLFIKKEDAILA